jgi:hypothetical protein
MIAAAAAEVCVLTNCRVRVVNSNIAPLVTVITAATLTSLLWQVFNIKYYFGASGNIEYP